MEIIKKPLSELKKPEKNVRIHTERQLNEFVRSLDMFKQIRPIVIDEDGVILAGSGLYDAMKRAGWKEAACYQYKGLNQNQKKKLMIADNKIFSLGVENLDTLNEFIEDLREDLDIPGYDEDILKQMVSDAEEVTEKLLEYGTMTPEQVEEVRRKTPVTIQQPVNDDAEDEFDDDEPAQESSDTTTTEEEDGRYIICPECGARIRWP